MFIRKLVHIVALEIKSEQVTSFLILILSLFENLSTHRKERERTNNFFVYSLTSNIKIILNVRKVFLLTQAETK